MELHPSKELEAAIKDINLVFESIKTRYWLCFGGLYGLVANRGIIPDGDFDICTYYGADYNVIKAGFEKLRYRTKKVVVNDVDCVNALYMSFDHPEKPHICVSFWYPYKNHRFYCHDQNDEIPEGEIYHLTKGYYFRGIKRDWIDSPEMFRKVEWLGVPGRTKIVVPRFPGAILDSCYPDWAYWKQRHTPVEYEDIPERCVSINNKNFNKDAFDRATSPVSVCVQSMDDFKNQEEIDAQIEQNLNKYLEKIKNTSNCAI